MPDSSANSTTARPCRRVSVWKALGIFCLAGFLVLLGVVFIPWDVKLPVALDLDPQDRVLAPADNAFTYLERASRLRLTQISVPGGGIQAWYSNKENDLLATERCDPVFAKEVLTANAAALAELDKAFACQHYASPRVTGPCPIEALWYSDKGHNCLPPSSTITLASPAAPWLDDYLALVSLQILKSRYLQQVGDYPEAVQTGLNAWRLGRLMMKDAGARVEWNASLVYQRLALHQLVMLGIDAKTPDRELQRILAELNGQDGQSIRNDFGQVLRREYGQMQTVLSTSQMRFGSLGPSDRIWRPPYFYKPNMTQCLIMENYRKQIAHVENRKPPIRQTSSPAIRNSLADWFLPNLGGRRLNSFLDNLYVAITPRFRLMIERLQSQANVLHVETALRQYEKKYGQRPDELIELVPEFLPANLLEGQPFDYSKKGKQIQPQEKRQIMDC